MTDTPGLPSAEVVEACRRFVAAMTAVDADDLAPDCDGCGPLGDNRENCPVIKEEAAAMTNCLRLGVPALQTEDIVIAYADALAAERRKVAELREALRAVEQLHDPERDDLAKTVARCPECWVDYPCPTVRIIAAARAALTKEDHRA